MHSCTFPIRLRNLIPEIDNIDLIIIRVCIIFEADE